MLLNFVMVEQAILFPCHHPTNKRITDFVSLLPKKAYFRPFGTSFNTKPSIIFFSSSRTESSSFVSSVSTFSISSDVDDMSSLFNSVVESDFVKHCSSGLIFQKSYSISSCEGIKVSIIKQLEFSSVAKFMLL